MAQRLIKRICPHCRVEVEPSELAKANFPSLRRGYKGLGCAECHQTGFKGRVGIYEFLPITKEIRRLIANRANEDELWAAARLAGTVPLFEAAQEKVERGEITAADMIINIMWGGAVTMTRRPDINVADCNIICHRR